MDNELKQLLNALCNRLENIEKRLSALESTSHKQITLDDAMDRARKVIKAIPQNRHDYYPVRDLRLC